MDENPRISDLRKKIEKDPGSRLFAQLAEELRKDGRLEDAIQVAYDGLQKHPAYPSARLTLARALLDSGRASEARPELEQIVKAAPDNILAGRLLGEALEALGESDAAIRQFERALVFSPGDKLMIARLAALKASQVAPAASPAPPPPAPTFGGGSAAVAAPVPEAPSLFVEAPAAAVASFFTEPGIEVPAVFGGDPVPAPSVFGGEAAAPSVLAEAPPPEAAAGASREEIPATLEMPAEPATIPFALSEAPVEFSESASSLPAFAFDEPAPVPAVVAELAPVPEPEPEPEPTPPPVSPPVPVPAPAFSLALDRDLASGTISPGAFNMAELQRHFEAIAAAERAAAAGQSAAVEPPPLTAAEALPVALPTVPELPVAFAPPPLSVPSPGDTQPPSTVPAEESLSFSDEFESKSLDTADTMSIAVPDGGFGQPPPEYEAFPYEEPLPVTEPSAPLEAKPTSAPPFSRVAADPDLASQTLPLTSLTLADLYLQQGLKAEAAAVLSQVVREEPSNEQARSKLAYVSAETAETLPEPAEHFADQAFVAEAPVHVPPSHRPRTPAEVRAATIDALKAFQGAIEREALEQKATEIRAR